MKTAEEKARMFTAQNEHLVNGDTKLRLEMMIEIYLKEQDRDTRHACAKAVAELPLCTTSNDNAIYDSNGEIVQAISLTDAHSACMNVKAV